MQDGSHSPTIGQILDRVYRLMKANLRGFLGLAIVPTGCAVVLLVTMLAAMFLVVFRGQWPTPSASPAVAADPAVLAALTFVMVLMYLGYMMVFAIYQPAASYAALQADVGIAVPFREAYAFAWNRAGRYIGLFLLRLLIVSGPILGAILVLGSALLIAVTLDRDSAQTAFLAIIPLLILVYAGGMVYGIFMMIRLALANPACVAEDLTVRAAIRRSFELSRQAKGRIFLVALVVYAAIYAAMMVCELIFGFVASVVAFPMVLMEASQTAVIVAVVAGAVLLVAAMLLVSAASSAAYATAFAVLYRDQRLRVDAKPEAGIAN